MTYKEYMKSPEWAIKRIEAFQHHGKCCSMCGTERSLEVHHLTYARMGNELMSDLQILCKTHHQQAHDILPMSELDRAEYGELADAIANGMPNRRGNPYVTRRKVRIRKRRGRIPAMGKHLDDAIQRKLNRHTNLRLKVKPIYTYGTHTCKTAEGAG